MRKLAAVFVAGALTVGAPVAVLAHHGAKHMAVYRMESGPRWMPTKVVIRCEGWAEDTASVLRIVRFGGGRPPVYRCATP